jgi:ABC-2 type transport system permease protein
MAASRKESKVGIIFMREFTTRVKNKLFLVTTLLMPLLFAVVMVVPSLVTALSENETYTIWVVDKSNNLLPKLQSEAVEDMSFVAWNGTIETLQDSLRNKKGKAGLVFGDYDRKDISVTFYASKNPSLKFEGKLKSRLKDLFREERLVAAGMSKSMIDNTDFDLNLTTKKVTEKGSEDTSSALGFIYGFGMGILGFMMVFIYGGILMKGVMEEKANRVVEVIVSSVKPMELMIGKILGVGAVGLLQFAIWSMLLVAISLGITLVLPTPDPAAMDTAMTGIDASAQQDMAFKVIKAIEQFEGHTVFFFVFYFFAGYLLYGSLFAAIGASIDQEADAGPFTTAISIPAYIPILTLGAVMNNPDGALAFWLSVFPLTSSTVMMARMAITDVPVWQVLLSMGLLVGATWGITWVAARIYRVGLLLYGKKLTFRELYRWITVKS